MNRIYLFLISLIVLICSCKKADQILPASDSKYSGHIYYTSLCYQYDSARSSHVQPIFYNAGGQFFKTPLSNGYQGQAENVGDIMIGNYQVVLDYNFNYNFSSAQRSDSLNIIQFGKKINFSISGGGDYSPAFATVYVPEVIRIYSQNEPNNMHSKQDSMIITWNADPNIQNIEIIIKYDGAGSHYNDSSLDKNDYYSDPITVPDNGQYILSASQFARFKKGSDIYISVVRRGIGEMKSNDKWIGIKTETTSVLNCIIKD